MLSFSATTLQKLQMRALTLAKALNFSTFRLPEAQWHEEKQQNVNENCFFLSFIFDPLTIFSSQASENKHNFIKC
jgi:hypothetical protein